MSKNSDVSGAFVRGAGDGSTQSEDSKRWCGLLVRRALKKSNPNFDVLQVLQIPKLGKLGE